MMVSLSPVRIADGLASLKRIRSKREVAKSMRHRLRSRESSADCGIEWEYGILWSERTRGPFTDGLSIGGSRGLPLTGARSSDQLAKQLGAPLIATAVLAQQAGAHEGEERQNREHRTHAVPEVPHAFVRGPRACQLARGRAGGDVSELLVHRHVHEDRKQEASPDIERAGQRDEPEAARPGPPAMGGERREQEQGGSEEAEEEQRVLYPLVYGLHGGHVVGIRLRRQAEVDRDRVGVEDAG